MSVFAKDPASTLDYSFDWSSWLAPGETITAANWGIEPAGATAPVLSGALESGAITATNVAGGQVGARYRLNCQINTSENRTAERSTVLRVMEM